jgi:hypothetical protein
MGFIDRARKDEIHLDGNGATGAGGFSAALIKKGKIKIVFVSL